MEPYRDISGRSGVAGFEFGTSSITIEFKDGRKYLYTDDVTGGENIRQMQQLARRGAGLATFINRFVRDRYAQRLH
jgi:hypothetical protein